MMENTHECVLVCTTKTETTRSGTIITYGLAVCVHCKAELDCPNKEHAHG